MNNRNIRRSRAADNQRKCRYGKFIACIMASEILGKTKYRNLRNNQKRLTPQIIRLGNRHGKSVFVNKERGFFIEKTRVTKKGREVIDNIYNSSFKELTEYEYIQTLL